MTTEAITEKVESILRTILAEKGLERDQFSLDESLYEDGIGLDSLDTATLSIHLETAFDADPYSSEPFPQTVAEIIAFYTDGS